MDRKATVSKLLELYEIISNNPRLKKVETMNNLYLDLATFTILRNLKCTIEEKGKVFWNEYVEINDELVKEVNRSLTKYHRKVK